MNDGTCGIYILTNPVNSVLYVGMSTDIAGRIWTHKEKIVDGFAKKYNCTKLVYYEAAPDKLSALEREKQIKKYSRFKKEQLVISTNPSWNDLSNEMGL